MAKLGIWVADPISGTKIFIDGLPHYGIALAYLQRGMITFGVIYDPSADELFTAHGGKGAFLNGRKIFVSKGTSSFIANISSIFKDADIMNKVNALNIISTRNSHAVNLAHIACGRYDGILCLSKDSFPYFAGSLLIREAGGLFTTVQGEVNFQHTARAFIGGNPYGYKTVQSMCSVLQQTE